jgi:hypothetical protein
MQMREMQGAAPQAARRQDAMRLQAQRLPRLPLLPDFLSAGEALASGVAHRRPGETHLMWADIILPGILIAIVTLIAIAPRVFR